MTINLDNTKMTLDFAYEDEDNDGVKTIYRIRFHYTVELGDTISISDHGSEYFSYPAKMFIEVGDFLKEQKIIKKERVDNKISKRPQTKIGDLLSPSVEQENGGVSGFGALSIPEIEGESKILVSEKSEEAEIEEAVEINETIINKYALTVDELPEPEVQEEDISEKDVEKQWQLREKMTRLAVDPGKMVKRRN